MNGQELTEEPSTASTDKPGDVFATTHWSVVLTAGESDTPRAREALGRLYQTYWPPLYAYVRRQGYNPPDAQDLIQQFFARLLEHNWLGRADRQKGRFRSFLLGALNHFLTNEWDKARAWKRGGRLEMPPLQVESVEDHLRDEPADTATPEQCYERRWALALLDEVMKRLGQEQEREGKAELYAALKPCLAGDREAQPYAVLAARLGLSEGAVKVAVHRLRQRYRQLLREEIAHTVASPTEVDAEMRHLFGVLVRR